MLTEAQREELIQAAIQARRWAYTPYSHFDVGAAVLTASGKIYDGCNIENAAYPVTVCGERVAVFKAVSQGEREIDAVVVASEHGATPCGSCRQVLNEFGPNMQVILVNHAGQVTLDTTLEVLLPGAFSPKDLLER